MNVPLSIIITEGVDSPTQGGLVYRWHGHDEGDGVVALLPYVEAHGERLREKYLAWIHDLGQATVAGRRVVEHLALEDGPSFWWMTLLAEKNPWKTPAIMDAIRLFAVEELLTCNRPAHVELRSTRRALHQTLRPLCAALGIEYRWHRRRPAFSFGLRSAWRALPESVRGLITLVRSVATLTPLRRTAHPGWQTDARAVFFCSYFLHLDCGESAEGRFHSHQWGDLPALLRGCGHASNWVHHFHPSTAIPDTASAARLAQRFNERPREHGFHSLLEGCISVRVICRAIRRWVKLQWAARGLRDVRAAFRPMGSQLSFWPLMRRDWQASLGGPAAVRNLFALELWQDALRAAPRQSLGLYLLENQGWERAFVDAWRRNGHGRLIAVAHSTTRFWDLRYFSDVRTDAAQGPLAAPQADVRVVNSDHALMAQLATGFPAERLRACEALRYIHLRRSAPPNSLAGRLARTRVLVLGDVLAAGTRKMMRLLVEAVTLAPGAASYTLKPHPNSPIATVDYPTLDLEFVTQPLDRLLDGFDLVYSSNMTSASADAYIAGLPVVVMLDEQELNFSPLRGQPDVVFVGTATALALALREPPLRGITPARAAFFHLDPSLTLWKRLLEETIWPN